MSKPFIATLLYRSGVAAISAGLLALLVPGDHLLMVESAYEPTRLFCDGTLERHGVGAIAAEQVRLYATLRSSVRRWLRRMPVRQKRSRPC